MKNWLQVETVVKAPIDVVWDSMTLPEHITQWCFASPEWHAPRAEQDLRVGGTFTTHMAAKDGSFSFDFSGVYTAVETHRFYAYALGDERAVEVSFEETPEGVKVVERFNPEDINPEDMQRMGWQAILDNFRKHTESLV